MAVTTENSTQYGRVTGTPPKANATHEAHGRLRFARASFVQGAAAGDAGSKAVLVKLPAGNVRLILPMCRIANSAFGAARVLDLGWQAYTDRDGGAVAAAAAGLDDDQDVAAAGNYVPAGVIGGDETKLFESRDGVVIEATVAGGTIPAAATLDCYFAYVLD